MDVMNLWITGKWRGIRRVVSTDLFYALPLRDAELRSLKSIWRIMRLSVLSN